VEEIVNRVAGSSLISLDLDDYIKIDHMVGFDFSPILFQGMILREKDLREYVKNKEWSEYADKNVYIHCSEDVVIPIWAFMLVATKLSAYAKMVIAGKKEDLERKIIDESLRAIDLTVYQNAKVVVKGCGNILEKEYAYTRITELLISRVSSLMYGEPWSTVPIYKKSRQK